MAVPKKRTGKSAQGHRRSNWKGSVPETTKCSNCGALALTHTVCEACGFYKGKAVSVKSAQFVEAAEVVSPKKENSSKEVEEVVSTAEATVETEAVVEKTTTEESEEKTE